MIVKARVIATCLVFVAIGCGTPQLGPDEESYKTVDALYTAVTGRRADLVTACESRLRERHDVGKLPDPVWKELSTIIGKSRDGNWEAACERLNDFMKRQQMQKGFEPSKR